MLIADASTRLRSASRTRSPGGIAIRLAHLEIDPLRPLNNLFWGYIQNEYTRLTRAAPRLRI